MYEYVYTSIEAHIWLQYSDKGPGLMIGAGHRNSCELERIEAKRQLGPYSLVQMYGIAHLAVQVTIHSCRQRLIADRGSAIDNFQ